MDYLEGRYCYFEGWWALIALLIIFWKGPVSIKSLNINFLAIFVAYYVVLIPRTKIAWRLF